MYVCMTRYDPRSSDVLPLYLHQVDPLGVVTDGALVQRLVRRGKDLPGDPRGGELVLSDLAGVLEVVDRQHQAGPPEALVVVALPVEEGGGSSMPVVELEDVWLLAADLKELQT